ncbi:hypothetical protein QBC37DRAFT_405828 [Rhypophila decipiens]|uniref:Uncharacterized protein n=1 Tax=Rhypophila decipiens TaxID=261697 RepID=A0AAN6Y1W4_9PEZI|nr:hypothetical protein QBC37DRAFT_405828 [Rhypophila decipiens]
MHFSPILLSLVATASAIDIYAYRSNEQCKGTDYLMCTNRNPGDCCAGANGNAYRAIGVRAIPSSWNIIGRGHRDAYCGPVRYAAASNGATDVCAGGNYYSGGSYIFAGKKHKRSGNSADVSTRSSGEACKADLVVLGDDTKYDLTKLDDAQYAELLAVFHAGGNSTAVPAKFEAFKIE